MAQGIWHEIVGSEYNLSEPSNGAPLTSAEYLASINLMPDPRM